MSAQPGTTLSCDDVRASIGAIALGVVDLDESAAIEDHLVGCVGCRDALARELDVVGALALAIEPIAPSPAARERLLAAIDMPPGSPEGPVSLDAARVVKANRRPLWPLAAAAAVLLFVTAAALGVRLDRALDQRDDARSTAELLSTYVSSGGQVVTMTAQDSTIYKYYKGQGSLLIAPGMEPMVVVAGCPESGDYLTYWVWVERDGERTRAGKLIVGDDGTGWLSLSSDQPLSEFDTIGITVVLSDETREDVLVAPLGDDSVTEG